MYLVRMLVNMLSLLIVVAILPNVYFVDRRVIVWVFLSLMLGLLNAFVKPLIAFLTLRFIFSTAGLVLAVINGLILALLSWLFPELLRVDSILAGLAGGLLLGIVSAVLEALLGLNLPIVAEKYPEIRERIKDRQFYRTQIVLPRIVARSLPQTGEIEAPVELEPTEVPPPAPAAADALAQAAPAVEPDKASLPAPVDTEA
jgi:putative membrane protein